MAGASEFLAGALPPCPESFNAAQWCLGAQVEGDRDALIAVDPDEGVVLSLSFDELRDKVARAASALMSAGVTRGDRVVLLLGDIPEFPIAYFGAIAAGAVATPLSSQLSDAEISSIMDTVQPKLVLGGPMASLGLRELDEGEPVPFAAIAAEDPALLVFTSGSGGRPKGVLHAHRAFWARQSMRAGWHGMEPGDRVMHAGAFNWTFTLGVGLADAWSAGATAIVNSGRRDPDVWPDLARTYRPTVFAAAPAVFRRILKYGSGLGDGFASLKHAVTAGEALSPAILESWRRETGKPLLEALGMSEVSTFVSTPPDRIAEAGLAGWPQPGRHVAVVGEDAKPVPYGETGVLAVRRDDPGLMLGYWRDAEATRAAHAGDWFLTGDLARMRSDGAITYLGRQDDRMNAQGYRVDPTEVEAALATCPGVAECGVTALEVADGLSVIAAWVVGNVTREAVLEHAASCLAGYKTPRELFRADELPHSANGKLLRRKLPDLPRTRL